MPCPICLNAEARVVASSRGLVPARKFSLVFCPTCPVPFEISGTDLEFLAQNPQAGLARRNRWAQLLAEAARRDETLYRLS
jgi:hypothetical protein